MASAVPKIEAPQPERPPAGGRPPSLEQLAKRINADPSGSAGSRGTSRPRLAANALRTGSAASMSTTASTMDSMAVNAPSTRSVSPTSLTPPQSTTPSIPENGDEGEPLTSERLEKLNQETQKATPEKKIKGYKNIPSLDAITARLAMARSLSIDGSAKPPDAEMIEDPKTPGIQMKAPEHPLQYPWTIYHDTKSKLPFTPATANTADATTFSAQPPESVDYEAGLTVIGEFETVETFCRYFNWLKPPSKLERNSNYHLFKSGIKPMWEDEANANGGKWVLTMKNNPILLDRCWSWLAMALVGEELEEGGNEICGAVVSLRSKVDRIQVWTRSKDDVERLNGIGKKLVKLLDVSEADNIGLEFQYNTDDRPLPNKFLTIQAMPTTSYRSTFANTPNSGNPHHAHNKSLTSTHPPYNSPVAGPGEGPVPVSASGGAFGQFGTGIGGGGTWARGGKRV